MIEDRLRDAMRAHVDTVSATPPPWDDIEERATVTRRRRTTVLAGLAAAAAVAVVVAAVAVVSEDDDGKLRVTDSPSTEPTATTVPDTATGTVGYDPAYVGGIYPDRRAYERDGHAAYHDAVETGEAFGRDYLGMRRPVATDVTTENRVDAETASGHERRLLHLRPGPGSPRVTTLMVIRVTDDGGPWTVVHASTSSIKVDAPSNGELVTPPVVLSGRAQAHEGTVQVRLRQSNSDLESPLGESTVTGAGDELAPFNGEVDYRGAVAEDGAITFYETSAEDGTTLAATVVAIRFEDTSRLTSASRLRTDRLGPLRFGMSTEDALAAAQTELVESRLPGCRTLAGTGDTAGLMLYFVEGRGLTYAIVKDGEWDTSRNIDLGSDEDEVRQAYPSVDVRDRHSGMRRLVVRGDGRYSDRALIFETEAGKVVAMWAAPFADADSDELCN